MSLRRAAGAIAHPAEAGQAIGVHDRDRVDEDPAGQPSDRADSRPGEMPADPAEDHHEPDEDHAALDIAGGPLAAAGRHDRDQHHQIGVERRAARRGGFGSVAHTATPVAATSFAGFRTATSVSASATAASSMVCSNARGTTTGPKAAWRST